MLKSSDLFPFIMENMGDAVCVTNRYGELQYMNPAAGKLLGIRLSQDSPTKIWEAIPFVETNDELIQLFIEAIQTGVNSRHVLVGYQNTEGRVSRVRVSLTRLGTDDGTFLIVLSDLTELLRVTDAFKRYTSPQIADYVLHTPGGEARGGASREISVLFADLRGSTALSAGLSPERLVEMLNRFFEKMSEVVNRFGGTVIEFLGDSVFAVFGAPTEDPDHAFHAVSCAVGMQNALQEVNETNRACGDPELSIGIGVHTGECVVGNIGSREKMKYGCVGETVNLAARIEALTVGGEVLISETSASAISAPMDITGRREFLPKGAREPMTALEITGIGPLRLLRHEEKILWLEVHPAAEVAFRFLDERKCVDETVRTGRMTALSPDGLYAVLRCEPEPALSADLMIDIGGDLYAKVTGRAEDGCLLCFTARPDRFGDWFKTLTGKALRQETE